MASCRATADLKGVGVQGEDSMMERRMFGVLNLRDKDRRVFVKNNQPQNLHNKNIRDRTTHISFSFWGLTVWSIRGLESTGELMGKLSSECSELIDWLRNCETRKETDQSKLLDRFILKEQQFGSTLGRITEM